MNLLRRVLFKAMLILAQRICFVFCSTHEVPASRIVPLWGGVAAGGFAEVLAHKNRKLTGGEWAKAVRAGKLQRARKQLLS